VVPAGDDAALADALLSALDSVEERRRRSAAGRVLAERFTWERALAPLVRFAQAPARDRTKSAFAHQVATRAPEDPALFRLRRWLKRRSDVA